MLVHDLSWGDEKKKMFCFGYISNSNKRCAKKKLTGKWMMILIADLDHEAVKPVGTPINHQLSVYRCMGSNLINTTPTTSQMVSKLGGL
jgi:hypothetical protein